MSWRESWGTTSLDSWVSFRSRDLGCPQSGHQPVSGFGLSPRLGTPVLYDGIQPAGDLMAGRGAERVAAGAVDELAQMFTHYSEPGALAGLRADLTPGAVPTWAEFARGVVAAAQPL